MHNITNEVWKSKVDECLNHFEYESNPRGQDTREVLAGTYTVPMPAYIDLAERKLNQAFMFQEAAWIICLL